ncbi:MAG: alpha/beta hydrolase-fold protein [Planctomycetota bacterium]
MRRSFLPVCIILFCWWFAGCATDRPPITSKAIAAVTPTAEGCTVMRLSVPSAAMGRPVQIVALLPPTYQQDPTARFPVLYALHGSSAACDCWADMAPLRAALVKQPMIVLMFDGDSGSMYLDSPILQTDYLRPPPKGSPTRPAPPPARSLFTTFFFDELIPSTDLLFRSHPKQRMLTGFSMGGYGAFHYMLCRPDAFVSVSSLSGAFMSMAHPSKDTSEWMSELLGDPKVNHVRFREVDIELRLIDAVIRKIPLPPIFLHCGSDDTGLVEGNRDFARFLAAMRVPSRYLETPGEHNWKFWRDASLGIIDFHWRTLHPQSQSAATK